MSTTGRRTAAVPKAGAKRPPARQVAPEPAAVAEQKRQRRNQLARERRQRNKQEALNLRAKRGSSKQSGTTRTVTCKTNFFLPLNFHATFFFALRTMDALIWTDVCGWAGMRASN